MIQDPINIKGSGNSLVVNHRHPILPQHIIHRSKTRSMYRNTISIHPLHPQRYLGILVQIIGADRARELNMRFRLTVSIEAWKACIVSASIHKLLSAMFNQRLAGRLDLHCIDPIATRRIDKFCSSQYNNRVQPLERTCREQGPIHKVCKF